MSKRFQPIGAEIEGNLKLLELQLENVEGGKMEVAFVFFTLVVIIPIDPLNSQIIFIKIKIFKNLLKPPWLQVHGFGPLNWLAGRKVSDLVQETLLQVIIVRICLDCPGSCYVIFIL